MKFHTIWIEFLRNVATTVNCDISKPIGFQFDIKVQENTASICGTHRDQIHEAKLPLAGQCYTFIDSKDIIEALKKPRSDW